MKRALMAVAGVTVLTLAVVGPAWAKGPTGATIAGPGIDDPIVIEGNGEMGTGEFSKFVEAAGFWQLVMGMENASAASGPHGIPAPPADDLGPRYTITWHLGSDPVTTDLYPDAAGGPVVHMAAQRLEFLDHQATEKWVAADRSLLTMLDAYDVPFGTVAAPETPVEAVAPVEAARSVPGESGPAESIATDPGQSVPWAVWLGAGLVAVTAALVLGRRRAGAA